MSCLGRAFGEEEWFNRYGQRAEGVIDRRIDARVRIAAGESNPLINQWRISCRCCMGGKN